MGLHGLKINEKIEFNKSNFFKVIFTHFYLRIKFMKQSKDEIYTISNDKWSNAEKKIKSKSK